MTTLSIRLRLALALMLISPVPALADGGWEDQWMGAYVGGSVGGGAAGAAVDLAPARDAEVEAGAATIGAFAGYNFAPFGHSDRGGWLIGAEIDANWFRTRGTENDPTLGKLDLESNFFVSTRARAGYAWEKFHLYGTAGLALSDLQVTDASSDDGLGLGVALGVGAEYAIQDNWLMRAEALTFTAPQDEIKQNGRDRDTGAGAALARVGVVYKF